MAALPPIQGSNAVSRAADAATAKGGVSKAGISKGGAAEEPNAFEHLLAQTNQDQKVSDQAIQDLVTGKNDNVQQVVMQVVKSEMSFQLFMEVRNQLIESYNELMRMQF